MEEETIQVDAIVVGGGPAGLSAAYTMAQEGSEVVVIERGEYAGSKNVGGLLYGTMLNNLIPEFYNKAPIERPVTRRSLIFLGGSEHMALDFGSDTWSIPPYNYTYIVHRSQFDRWFAAEVEEAGASILEGTVVDDLLYDSSNGEKQVAGVKVRGEEEFLAPVVILADGANPLVSEKALKTLQLHTGLNHQAHALGVKEIIALPKEKIEDRFQLGPEEGAALDFIGVPFDGLIGGGFIYTEKETVSIGFVAKIDTIVNRKIPPHHIIDTFKKHPKVRKYIEGGELLEYSAHIIPEGGYKAVPDIFDNGMMIAGDAAGLVNMSLYKEGTNHAVESGHYAGLTALEAQRKANFSKDTLRKYGQRLHEGVVMRDLKKYSAVPDILDNTPELLDLYPKKVTNLLVDFFTVSHESKSEIQKRAFKQFLKGLPKFQFVKNMIRSRKLM